MSDYEIRNPKAAEIVDSLFPATGRTRLAQYAALDPQYAQLLEDLIFGGMYARDVLDQKTRELCALAALVALGRRAQTRTHVLASLNAGATPRELREVVMQTGIFAGFPASLEAMEVVQATLAEIDAE